MRARAHRLQVSADNYAKGAAGEVAVARVLGDLASEFVVLHDLNVPGSSANVDHLVIGPTGVFMIDAKHWSGRLTAGADTLWRGTTSVRRECSTAVWEAQQLSNAVGRAVQPIICFVGTALPEAVQHCDGVTLCESDALLFLVRDGIRWLDAESVAAIAAVARPLVRTGGQCTATAPATQRELQTVAMPIIAAEPPPAAARQHRRAVARRAGTRPMLVRVLPPVLAVGILAGTWALGPSITKFVADSFSDNAPAGAAASASTAPIDSSEVGGPVATDDFLPPLIGFTCPTPGGGWMVTASPSEFRSDPGGFGIWYLAPTDAWVRWGTFRSGISGPSPFGPVQPGATVQIKVERDAALVPSTAAVDLQAIAPTDPC
jgi:hypothetical protein